MNKPEDIQLEGLSRSALVELQSKLDKQIAAQEKQELKDLVTEVRELIEERGFKLSDVLPHLKAGKALAPAKFVNPENPEQRWSGRGRKPHWFTEAIQNGVNPEDLEVK